MKKYILALNCGSSSLKFTLFAVNEDQLLEERLGGAVEEIGNAAQSSLKIVCDGEKNVENIPLADHREALEKVFEKLAEQDISSDDIISVGHRVVHGGTKYRSSVKIDDDVINTIEELTAIAPLHNPPNLVGINVAMELLPNVSHVAVFDTAFHSSIPEHAFRYAVPEQWYKDYGVRTYGFHGTSHLYVSRRGAKFVGKDSAQFNGITAHLGNGCSISKIENGKSTDTSMGFTPLEGVVMGTRSGDVDVAIVDHVVKKIMKRDSVDHAEAFAQVMSALNKESGLKALAQTNMMQDIRAKAEGGDIDAELVISLYAYRIAKYIGAYWATMDNCDAIIFTAGLGENEGYVRNKVAEFLKNLKITIDDKNNAVRGEEVCIGESALGTKVLVVPTDEEIVIGYDALHIGVNGKKSAPQTYLFEK